MAEISKVIHIHDLQGILGSLAIAGIALATLLVLSIIFVLVVYGIDKIKTSLVCHRPAKVVTNGQPVAVVKEVKLTRAQKRALRSALYSKQTIGKLTAEEAATVSKLAAEKLSKK